MGLAPQTGQKGQPWPVDLPALQTPASGSRSGADSELCLAAGQMPLLREADIMAVSDRGADHSFYLHLPGGLLLTTDQSAAFLSNNLAGSSGVDDRGGGL